MDRRPLKTRDKSWPKTLARSLVKLRLTPNAVSVLSIVFAGLVCWALAAYAECWIALLLAAVGIQARLLCNLLDGLMAVEFGAKSKTGELFNEVPDRLADSLILVGAGVAAGSSWLGWLGALLAMSTAYLRALGASLGHGQDFCGPGAKPHRMFVLTVGCLAQMAAILAGWTHNFLLWTLTVAAALTALTALRRLWHLARYLEQK